MEQFVDAHYHIWSVEDASSGHDLAILGGPAELHPTYNTQV